MLSWEIRIRCNPCIAIGHQKRGTIHQRIALLAFWHSSSRFLQEVMSGHLRRAKLTNILTS